MSLKSFLVTAGVMMYDAAWRRDCSVSRLPSVMIFSATGRAAFARVIVVVMRPCSSRLVTRFRSVARRCHGLRPSFDPDFRCRIFPFPFACETSIGLRAATTHGRSTAAAPDKEWRGKLAASIAYNPPPRDSSDDGGSAVWLGSGG